MRTVDILALVTVMYLVTATPLSSHVGDTVIVIPELTDQDLVRIDMKDISVDDWRTLLGPPTLLPTDFYIWERKGGIRDFYYDTHDFEIWLGWHGTTSRLYVAMARYDDKYLNEYRGASLVEAWRHDSYVEVMVDGDHSGGQYSFDRTCCQSEDDWRTIENRQAQRYVAISMVPFGGEAGYLGPGMWVNYPPYTEAYGGVVWTKSSRALTVLEFYITVFDELDWRSASISKRSELQPGDVIGLNILVPDIDDISGEYESIARLSPHEEGKYDAGMLRDFVLVSERDKTIVEKSSWGAVKGGAIPFGQNRYELSGSP